MRTAVDTSVLLDVLGADPESGERSRAALERAYDAGALVASDVVWAEVGAHAMLQADRLLARDRGYYRDIFSGLEVVDPGAQG